MPRRRAFTLLELVAILVVVAVAAALLMPGFGRHHRGPRRQMPNNTQLRGIHQGMVMYAQGNGNYFPGLNKDGRDADLSVENRLQILLEANYFTGDYAVSPSETKTVWTTGPVTSANYSYAMLHVPAAGGRRDEWFTTLNTQAIALSDRNVGTASAPLSVHAQAATHIPRPPRPWRPLSGGYGYSQPDWRGTVVYNDNHVIFESTHLLETRYGVAAPNKADDLFQSPGTDDALMIHSGN